MPWAFEDDGVESLGMEFIVGSFKVLKSTSNTEAKDFSDSTLAA